MTGILNWSKVRQEAKAAVEDVLHTAEANEPTIGAVVRTALEGAGVPPVLASAAVDTVEGLLAHFQTEHSAAAHASTSPATPPAPAPAVGTSGTPVAPASVGAESEPAPTDPFAPAAS